MAKKTIAFELNVTETGNTAKVLDDMEMSTRTIKEQMDEIEDATRNISKATRESAATKNLQELNKVVDENVLGWQELGQAVDSYRNIARAAGFESPVGQEALKQAAALEDEMFTLQTRIQALSTRGKELQTALQVGGGIIAGYTAFQGVTAMLGVENEKLLETVTKLQAAQALLLSVEELRNLLEKDSLVVIQAKTLFTKAQAVATSALTKATGTAIVATKGLTAALIATGVGAIAVAVGLLVSNWEKFTGWVMKLIPGLEIVAEFFGDIWQSVTDFVGITSDATRAIERMVEISEKMRTENDLQIKKLQALGGEEQKIYELRRRTLRFEEATLALKAKNNEATEEEIARLRELAFEIEILDIQEQQRLDAELARIEQEQQAKAAARAKELEAERQHAEDLRALEEEEMMAIRDLRLQLEATEAERLEARFADEREAVIAKYGAETELLKFLEQKQAQELQEFRDAQKLAEEEKAAEERELEIEKRQEQFEQDMEWLQLGYEEQYMSEMNFLNTLLQDKLISEENYAQRKKEIDANLVANQKNADAVLVASKQAAVGALSSLLGQVAQAAGEGTTIAKVAAGAQIAIDTATGISSAIAGASSAAAAGGPAAPFLMAVYIASGIATVLGSMMQAKNLLGKAGGSTPSAGTANIPRPSLPTPDQAMTGFNQDEDRVLADEGMQAAPVMPPVQRVVVLASDVSDINEENEMIDTVSTWGG